VDYNHYFARRLQLFKCSWRVCGKNTNKCFLHFRT